MGGGGIASCLNTYYDLIFDVMIFSRAEGEQDCLSSTTQLKESLQKILCILFWVFMNSRFWVKLRVRSYIATYCIYSIINLVVGRHLDPEVVHFKISAAKCLAVRNYVHSLL